LRDSEVYADLEIRLCGMMPGMQVIEADDSEEAETAARLVRRILDHMSGSTLLKLRDGILREALVSGFAIAEEVQDVYDDSEFGQIIGLRDIKLKPSEDFEIITDSYGNITSIQQRGFSGTKKAPLDRIIYYAYKATSDNPYGRSIFHGAYNAYKLKAHVFREYAMFLDANAGGIRKATISKNDFRQQRDKVKQILNRLSSDTSIVIPDSVDLDIQLPSGAAGEHFVKAIREVCNKEIRKAILYDESINAEGMSTGSYASKKVSQNIVYEALAIQGQAFAEIVSEQLIKRLLVWNGYEDYPTPLLVPLPQSQHDADPAAVIQSLATAYTSGLISEPLPQRVQEDIQRKMVQGFGVVWPETTGDIDDDDAVPEADTTESPKTSGNDDIDDKLTEPATDDSVEKPKVVEKPEVDDVPPKKTTKSPKSRKKGEFSDKKTLIEPAGRSRVDLQRIKTEKVESREKAISGWEDVIDEIRPNLEKAIGEALFDKDGNWRKDILVDGVPKLGVLRKSLFSVTHTGGTALRGFLTKINKEAYIRGKANADKMSQKSVKAGILPTKPLTSKGVLDIIRQDVYMALAGFYERLDRMLFYAVRNIMMSNASPQEVSIAITGVLNAELGVAHAGQIVTGMLESGYGMGMTEVFSGDNDIIGWKYDAVIDDLTCDECIGWHNVFIRAGEGGLPSPPMHPNCRCELVPVYANERPSGWIADGRWATPDELKELGLTHRAKGWGGIT